MRQLQQRQRVAPSLGDDPVAHPLVQRNAQCRAEQRARITVSKAFNEQLGQSIELFDRLACRDHQRDRVSQQPSRDKRQRLRRGPVQPLCIIYQAQQRPLLAHVREQAEHRQPNEEPVRRVPSA